MRSYAGKGGTLGSITQQHLRLPAGMHVKHARWGSIVARREGRDVYHGV
jgi:hypothetical protein